MNSRFSEYATSGAFTLSLTRNQVSALAMLEGGGPAWDSAVAALERKGLAEPVPQPTESDPTRVEMRATRAGLLVAALTQEAGLTNGPPDPAAVELANLRAEILKMRSAVIEAEKTARSALARKAELEWELENERRKAAERRLALRIIPRDPLAGLTDAELMARFAPQDQ